MRRSIQNSGVGVEHVLHRNDRGCRRGSQAKSGLRARVGGAEKHLTRRWNCLFGGSGTLGGCHELCASRSVALWSHRVPYGFTFVAHAGPEPGQKQPHSARCYSNTRSRSHPPGVVPHGWRLCSRQRCRLILFRGFRRRKKKKRGGVIAVLVTGLLLTDPDDFSRTKAH